jgi:putative Mn2+ efflux pump MntP
MPISKTTLKSQIKAAFEAAKANTSDAETALDVLCEAMALAIATQIQAGVQTAIFVNVPVLTAGPVPVTGTVTTTATNTIT